MHRLHLLVVKEEVMNKYQKYILNEFRKNFYYGIFRKCCFEQDELKGSWHEYGNFDGKQDAFNIKQDDDINKTRYVLIAAANFQEGLPFSKVFAQKNEEWFEVPCEEKEYRIVVDFNDRITAVKIVFANNLANDYIVKITYTEADKEKYYAKKEQERKDELLKEANIKVSTGADLVNIYFQPCCDKYDHAEIKLFVPKDYVTVGGPHGPVQKPSSWSIIKKCDIPIEDFYKSINGLAYGQYAFVLKQFDKKENIILETDYITFKISKA